MVYRHTGKRRRTLSQVSVRGHVSLRHGNGSHQETGVTAFTLQSAFYNLSSTCVREGWEGKGERGGAGGGEAKREGGETLRERDEHY